MYDLYSKSLSEYLNKSSQKIIEITVKRYVILKRILIFLVKCVFIIGTKVPIYDAPWCLLQEGEKTVICLTTVHHR